MGVEEKKNFLPDEIILEKLVGKPEKFEMSVLGGIDTDCVWILNFALKSEQWASATLSFDKDVNSIGDISFGFEGIDKLLPEDFFGEFIEKSEKEELSILRQASSILNGRDEYKKYNKAIEERIIFITKTHLKGEL